MAANKKKIQMGRRSSHTPEELRELILETATQIISEGGLSSLSAREVARRIAYSAGTLYNVFENLDDLVLTIEARLLDSLASELDRVPAHLEPSKRILELSRAYLAFTSAHPRLWNLLFEHHLPPDRRVPVWYQQKLDGLMNRVAEPLAQLMPQAREDEVRRSASVLWAGVHGITSLATADKLSSITSDAAGPLVDHLVQAYLRGLAAST